MGEPNPEMKCGGVIDELTTREDLMARGFTKAGADEVLAFRDRLANAACPSCGARVDVAGGREGTHWYRDHGTYNEHVCKRKSDSKKRQP